MRNGTLLVGYGMARAALTAYQPPCKAIASIQRDGTAFVRSGATDIGSGTYTVMTMLAADCLGVPIERVQFGLGDSSMPKAPQQGGSGLTGALGNAVQAACVDLVRAFVSRVSDDEFSPIKGCRLETITVRDGGIQITDDPARFETYADIITRHGLDEISIEAESTPPREASSTTMIARAGRFVPFTAPSTGARAHAGAFAAHFVEVHVDPDLGTIRVARVVSAVDGGRILNPKTARGQIIGGIAGGIGMALLEETGSDHTGRVVNTSLANYVVAVNADVRDVDVLFVGQPDSMTPSVQRVSVSSPSPGWRLRSPMRSITPPARGSARCRSLSRRCSDTSPPARAPVRRSTQSPEEPGARATRPSELTRDVKGSRSLQTESSVPPLTAIGMALGRRKTFPTGEHRFAGRQEIKR